MEINKIDPSGFLYKKGKEKEKEKEKGRLSRGLLGGKKRKKKKKRYVS